MSRAARAERFYGQWHRLLVAGMPPVKSLQELARRFPGETARFAREVQERIFPDEAAESPQRVCGEEWEWQILRTGKRSGQLPAITALLAQHFAEEAQLQRQLRQRAAYPFFLFHLGAILLALPAAVAARDVGEFFSQVAWALAWLYGVLALLGLGVVGGRFLLLHGPTWDRLILALPGIGRWRMEAVALKLARLLELQLQAGAGVLASLEGAAGALGSAAFGSQVFRAREAVRGGASLSEAMGQVCPLPETFREAIWTGEQTGNLVQEFRRVAEELAAARLRRLQWIGEWLPRLFYLAIVALLAWRIIGMMSRYYHSLGGLLEGAL